MSDSHSNSDNNPPSTTGKGTSSSGNALPAAVKGGAGTASTPATDGGFGGGRRKVCHFLSPFLQLYLFPCHYQRTNMVLLTDDSPQPQLPSPP